MSRRKGTPDAMETLLFRREAELAAQLDAARVVAEAAARAIAAIPDPKKRREVADEPVIAVLGAAGLTRAMVELDERLMLALVCIVIDR